MFYSLINKILKRRVINSINILSFGSKELVFDIQLSEMVINSIEYNSDIDNSVTLHFFNGNLDISYDFDYLVEKDKLNIIKALDSI